MGTILSIIDHHLGISHYAQQMAERALPYTRKVQTQTAGFLYDCEEKK